MPRFVKPFKFAFHDGVKDVPPPHPLFDKLFVGKNLSRLEKNKLPLDGFTRSMGWTFNFKQFQKRFLVHYRGIGWRERYAMDKTGIKAQGIGSAILEIYEIPKI